MKSACTQLNITPILQKKTASAGSIIIPIIYFVFFSLA